MLLLPIFSVSAQGLLANITCATSKNNCELNDFVRLAVEISKWILGITGSLALLAFIYGGFVWMLSGGSSERVQKGKQIFTGAVIGLVIVFTSYMIIGFVLVKSGFIQQGDNWATTAFDWTQNRTVNQIFNNPTP